MRRLNGWIDYLITTNFFGISVIPGRLSIDGFSKILMTEILEEGLKVLKKYYLRILRNSKKVTLATIHGVPRF